MPAPQPKDFPDDVVAAARCGGAPVRQTAKAFRIAESFARN